MKQFALLISFALNCLLLLANKQTEQALRDSALHLCQQKKVYQAASIIEENTVISLSNGDKILVFSPHEKIVANFISGKYETIIQDIKNGISEECGYMNKSFDKATEYYLDAPDTLERALSANLKSLSESISKKIAQSNLNENEKQFLHYKLQFSENYGRLCSIDKIALSEQLQNYALQTNIPELSAYCNRITQKAETKTLEAGTMLYSGSAIFTGELADYFSNSVPIGIGFDFGYSRLHLFSQFGISTDINNKSDAFAQGWDSDSKTYLRHMNISIAYNISNWDEINIFPIAGIHSSSLQTMSDNSIFQSDSPNNTYSGIKPMYGFAVDYNFALRQCDDYRLYELEQNIVFIRIQALHVPNIFGNATKSISGDMLFGTIGIGIYTTSFM